MRPTRRWQPARTWSTSTRTWKNVLTELQFLDPENPRHLMRRLRRLFIRANPDQNEVNILRGILSAVDKKGSRNG